MIQKIIDMLGEWGQSIIEALPLSPFLSLESVAVDNDILRFIAWFVPFPQIVALLETWGVCVGIYYLWMIIARWVKLIE